MPEQLSLPVPPAPPEPPPFAVVGALAPLAVAVVLFAVVREASLLLLAVLTPVVAVAGVLDGRRQVRRRTRRDDARHAAALDAVARAAAARQAHLEGAERRAAPGPEAFDGRVRPGEGLVIGTEDRMIDPLVAGAPRNERERELVAASAVLRRVPVVLPPTATIGVAGPPLLVEAFGRAVRTAATAVAAAGDPVRTGSATAAAQLEVRLDGPCVGLVVRGPSALRGLRFRPALLTRRTAVASAPPVAAVPTIADLTAAPSARGGLTARFAVADGEPVDVDLVADGPHAIVAGTTGSGKSALLVAWVLALAAAHPPDRVVLLLVDHKGGAAFDAVASLPHVAGVVTDLDAAGTDRAVRSLQAELRRREQVLRDAAVSDVAGTAEPRLVVVVDEFRALLEARPALAAVFTDVAARGRSLGMHLVLCTQRPAGSIRDELATNCGLRIALRVLDAADSTAVVGTPAAAALPRDRTGAAVLAVAGEPPRSVTVARVDADGVRAALAHALPGTPARRPWLDPLPERLPVEHLPLSADGLVLGLVDAPDEQAQPPLVWRPTGGLLIAGDAGSGRSTALVLVAGLLGAVDPGGDPATAWDAAHDDSGPLVLDDLEALLDRLGPAAAAAFVDRLARRLRSPAAPVALAVRGPSAWAGLPLRQLAGLCSARLLLSLELDDHLALGGERAAHRSGRRPGAAVWQGRPAQLALPSWPRAAAVAPEPPLFEPAGPAAVLVTTRPAARLAQLRDAGVRARAADTDEGAGSSLTGSVLVGSVADWQAQWARFSRLASAGTVLVDAVAAAEVRALTGSATPLPPVSGPDDVLALRPGDAPSRMRLVRRPG
ncbi:MAG TPA: FtsK/SpoIIIE domain-containing protein [Amnibacterium sp.]|nr:FtsK/SpoIIIE domain-containing protein [Amnibacterium sp.]